MIITAITPQKRKKNRVNIFLDGKFAFSLPLELLVKHRLTANQQLTQEQVSQFMKESDFDYIYARVLNLLSHRPRSRREIEDYCKKYEVGEETKQLLFKKLEKNQLVNDFLFAEWFVEQRLRFLPKGKRLIALELRQKGISSEIIVQVLGKVDENIRDTVLPIVTRKMKQWQKLPEAVRRQKIVSFLGRRGYDFDTIGQVLKELKQAPAFDALD